MDERGIVEATVELIEQGLGQELDLDSIAERIGYSKFYLNRMFSERVGYTIWQYTRLRRLTAAARQLVETDRPIVEIAFEAGYDSQQAFTTAFSREYGRSPRALRRGGEAAPLLLPYVAARYEGKVA